MDGVKSYGNVLGGRVYIIWRWSKHGGIFYHITYHVLQEILNQNNVIELRNKKIDINMRLSTYLVKDCKIHQNKAMV